MLYLRVSRPNYKMIELKDDITIPLYSCYKRLHLLLFQTYILNSKIVNISLREDINEPYSDITHLNDLSSWRVENDENIYPVVSDEMYRYESSDNNLIRTEIR